MKINKLNKLILATLLFGGCGGGGGGSANNDLCSSLCSLLNTNLRIVGDTDSCTKEASPVVQIRIGPNPDTASNCTGTLITSDSVITAGHCIPINASGLSVIINDQPVVVTQAIVHPLYRVDFVAEAVFYDVAILKLATPQPNIAKLPINLNTNPLVGDNIVFGYGVDNSGLRGDLRSGLITINEVTTNHIISLYDGSKANSCDGDSGGPLVLTNSCSSTMAKNTGIVGIVSTGKDRKCQAGDRALYTNLQDPAEVSFISANAPGTVFLR